MVPGGRSPMHLDALNAAMAAASGGFADAPTAMSLASWGRWPVSSGEQASGCGAVLATTSLVPWIPARKEGNDEGSATQG